MSIRIHGFAFCEHPECLAAASTPDARLCPACAAHETDPDACCPGCDTADEQPPHPGEALASDCAARAERDRAGLELLEELLAFAIGRDYVPARSETGACDRFNPTNRATRIVR